MQGQNIPPSRNSLFGVLRAQNTKKMEEPRGRRRRLGGYIGRINRGGQLKETASVNALLTEAVVLWHTASVNFLTEAVGLSQPPQLVES